MKQSEPRLRVESYEPNFHSFTVEDLRAIYRHLEHQYIPYEDAQAHAVLTRIMKIIETHDLAGRDNQAT